MNYAICKFEIGLQIIKGLLKEKEIILAITLSGFRHSRKCGYPFGDIHYYLCHHLCGDSVKLVFKWVLRLYWSAVRVWNPDTYSNHCLLYCKATTSVLPPHLVLHFSQANVSNGTFAVLILTGAEEKKRAWQPSGVVSFLFLFLITSLLPNWYHVIIS